MPDTAVATPPAAAAAPAAASTTSSTSSSSSSAGAGAAAGTGTGTGTAATTTQQTTVQQPGELSESSFAAGGEFDQTTFEDVLDKTFSKAAQARGEEQTAVEDKTPPVAAAGQGTETEEQRLAREQAGKQGTEQTDAEKEAAAKAAQQTTGTEIDLNAGTYDNKWLDGLLTDKTITVADDATKNLLHKLVRERGEYGEIATLFGNDAELAQAAKVDATHYMRFDDLYSAAQTPQGTYGFLKALEDMEAQQPILPNGEKLVDRLVLNIRDANLRMLEKKFKEAGDDDALDALNTLKARISPESAPAQEQLSEAEKRRKADLDAREADLNKKTATQRQQEVQQFEETVEKDMETAMMPTIQKAVEKSAFAPGVAQACMDRIFNEIATALEKDQFHRAKWMRIYSSGPGEETRKKLVAHNLKFFHAQAPDIIRRAIADFQQPVIRAQEDTDTKLAQQQGRSSTEPRGAGGAPQAAAATPTSPEAQLSAWINEYRTANNGANPSVEWLLEKKQALAQKMRTQGNATR